MYDIKDSRGVPVSGGIPPIVRISAIIGIIIIFIIGGIVVGASRYGHVWPSTDSMHIRL